MLANLAGGVARRRARRRGCCRQRRRSRRICWSSAPASAACAAPSTPRSCVWRAIRANALIAAGKTVKILCVGKKGYDQLRRTHEKQIIELIDLRAVRTISYATAQPIAKQGDRDVRGGRVRRLHAVLRALPLGDLADPDRAAADPAGVRAERTSTRPSYDYEPDEGEILAQLLPQAVAVRIYRALLENMASFFGAQMSAMDNATRNAGEMVKKYTLRYNRTRQAMITKELIEIISGAEAL